VFYGSNHVEYPELQDPREIFDFRDSRYLNPLPEIRYHGSSPIPWANYEAERRPRIL
jgi:hypothetical protein